MVYFMWGQPPTKKLSSTEHAQCHQGVENITKTHYDETESVSFTKLKKLTFNKNMCQSKLLW